MRICVSTDNGASLWISEANFFKDMEKAGFVRLMPDEYIRSFEATGHTLYRRISGPPDTQSKSDFHQAGTETGLPRPLELAEPDSSLKPPKTLQEIYNLLSCLDMSRLERAVDQWLVAGYVTNQQYRHLTSSLFRLVEVSDRLRQDLLEVLVERPHPVAEEAGG